MNSPDVNFIEVATLLTSGCIGSIIIFTFSQLPGIYQQMKVMNRKSFKPDFSDTPLPKEQPATDIFERLKKQAENKRRK